MIGCFKKSLRAEYIAWGITAAVIAFNLLRNSERAGYILIISTVLLLLLGITAGRIVGNIVANSEHYKLLKLLHAELRPEEFIKRYKEVLKKLPKDKSTYAICSSYVADALSMSGEYEEAGRYMDENFSPAFLEVSSLKGLYLNNMFRYAALNKDVEKAEKLSEELKTFLSGLRAPSEKNLSGNLSESFAITGEYLKYLKGEKADVDFLEEKFAKAGYMLRKLEIARFLVDICGEGNDVKREKSYREFIEKASVSRR